MTAVTSYWNRLSVPSRVVLVVLPTLLVLGAVATVAIALLVPPLVDFLAANPDLVRFVVAVLLVLVATIPTAFVIILLELKVIARMNLRVGPDRVGPFGAGDERGPRPEGARQGGLHPARRRRPDLHASPRSRSSSRRS